MWKRAIHSLVRSRPQWTPEARLLRGTLPVRSDHQSLLFLTVHKCASVYVSQLLAKIAESERVVPINLDGFFYKYPPRLLKASVSTAFIEGLSGKPFVWSDDLEHEVTRVLRPCGFMYGPFRTARLIGQLPHFDQFKVLVQLRDPRDVLTSLYYSVAFSHHIPAQNPTLSQSLIAMRKEASAARIDEFVVKQAPRFVETYRQYCQQILSRRNVLLVKYEDMVTDFPRWLSQVLRFWGFSPNSKTALKLVATADFGVSLERQDRHKRQVKPGDHLRKLQPRTIDALNVLFWDILVELGYVQTGRRYARAA